VRTRRLGNDPQLQKVTKPAPLSLGSKGSGVAQVQDLLVSIGFKLPKSMSSKGADGVFGAETEKAVKEFQQANGLKVDGFVGPATLEMLEQIIEKKPGLESPDPGREALLNQFDVAAPASQKRSVYQ
jgi:peptidoglycan hydrolase-like protein with peptidoglycan-binding domain